MRNTAVHLMLAIALASVAGDANATERGLVGYWKLQGDCRDYSGQDNHGVNHGVDLESAEFNGRETYVEVPDAPELHFALGDFSCAAEVYIAEGVDDVLGDIITKFDPKRRQGFNWTFASNTSGYNSQSDLRHLFFGVDDGSSGEWIDCGRPGGKCHSSDALTVFEGDLFAGTSDAPDEQDWAHVYRYKGGQEWEDCGRVGEGKTRGVYALIVHDGALYAGTAGPHSGGKANTGDFGRVYRYRGGKSWEDLGQPGEHYRINSLASYRGRLYALAINTYGVHGGVYVYEGDAKWKQCGDFGRPHTSGVHDGRLYAAFPQGEVFSYEGADWDGLGNPYGAIEQCNQLHSHGVHGGELYVGTWPLGKVAVRRGDKWVDTGRLGDATEVVGLTAYNGSFYGGTIPRAEVFRLDGPQEWTSLGRLFDPSDYDAKEDVEDWTRASSLRVFQGKLFCTTATCYRALIEQPRPNDIRGKVFSYQAGAGVSYDHDLGAGWKRIAGVRDGGVMKLYVDGRLAAESPAGADSFDVSTEAPLRIGFGAHSHFKGKIREVRLYNRAMSDGEVRTLAHVDDRVEFNRDVRPILSDKCFACHGPDRAAREAELRLDVEQEAKADRGGYAAIVAGAAEQSALISRVRSADEGERMPPVDHGKPLTAGEIDVLTRWVDEGAAWQMAWSYLPPVRHTPPELNGSNWPLNWIDQFIFKRLESEGLQPSPEADKTRLIRRLYIDLIGLPPAPEEVDAFLADQSPAAYEELVDRLLASPHFGERMAMYWLDLVRYADTVGYHGDQEHHISPYRDNVINALNANMPFDQFTREQLAGDLLPDPTVDQRIATGYNRVHQTSHEGGVQPKEYLAIYAADHVRSVSAVWMGATLGCAQCHDHKYDPYTIKDFYSMAAFFADVDEAKHLTVAFDVSPTPREPELELPTADEESRLGSLATELQSIEQKYKQATTDGDNASAKALGDQLAKAQAEIDAIRKQVRRTMVTVATEPREMKVLPRGNWLDDSGEVVQPAIPEFLGRLPVSGRRATRLDLANWLTDAEGGAGGLTARVMANRIWYLFFGRGLSASLDDFGGQGFPPDHPELLDALAVEFVESGWDVKHMVKLLVTSRAYRQASLAAQDQLDRDPLNRLVARQGRYRFPAELVRDTALSVSGLLVPTIGGASARPYQPAGYYKHLNFPVREYEPHVDQQQWRRGVYTHWQRQYLHPMLKAFDAPTREECTAERPRSNTALAALVLLNDPTFTEAARTFAARIIAEGGRTTSERLNFTFRLAASRSADEEEQRVLSELLARSLAQYRGQPGQVDALLGVGLAKSPNDVDRAELAAWTMVARAVLNLNEVITRN